MKKTFFVVAFIAMTSLSMAQELVTYSKSGFEANFPKKPKVEKESVKAEGYKINLTMYLSEVDADFIMVAESLLPKEISTNLDNETSMVLLKSTKDGALNNMAASMGVKFESTKEEEVVFQGFPALRIVGTMSSLNVNALFINRNGQLYQVLVFGMSDDSVYNTFIDTFKLI